MKTQTLSVILPTYNEAGNITRLIKKIRKTCRKLSLRCRIIVVDDNSTDGTAQKVKQQFGTGTGVRVFVRKRTKGLATAIQYGLKYVTGNYILVMDTDFNHDPEELVAMLALIRDHDLVIGSRYIRGGGMENKMRHWLSFIFNRYLMILLGHTVYDNLSGFFLIRRKALQKLELDAIFSGFGEYFIRLIHQAHQKNLAIVETPVFYKNRTHGVSKSRFLHMFLTYTNCAIQLKLKRL